MCVFVFVYVQVQICEKWTKFNHGDAEPFKGKQLKPEKKRKKLEKLRQPHNKIKRKIQMVKNPIYTRDTFNGGSVN
jgi:hypothetical protein